MAADDKDLFTAIDFANDAKGFLVPPSCEIWMQSKRNKLVHTCNYVQIYYYRINIFKTYKPYIVLYVYYLQYCCIINDPILSFTLWFISENSMWEHNRFRIEVQT